MRYVLPRRRTTCVPPLALSDLREFLTFMALSTAQPRRSFPATGSPRSRSSALPGMLPVERTVAGPLSYPRGIIHPTGYYRGADVVDEIWGEEDISCVVA
jgi:hypothetical protein